jgi:uncharacterized protein YndB with AHSA1/START domain
MMANSRFVYVTYIRTTQERLWDALTNPQTQRTFWFGYWQDCAWSQGAAWQMQKPDGSPCDEGEVEDITPMKSFVLSWRNVMRPELAQEGVSRMSCALETQGELVKLTVIHEMALDGSQLISAVSQGWPIILSSLKTYLETGAALTRPEG